MKSIGEALELIEAAFSPTGPERLAISSALGRFIYADIASVENLPPFTNSAMDGYAVRADELAGAKAAQSIALPVLGESRAGEESLADLAPGSVMRIFTGAPIPPGADAVVMQEKVERVEDRASFASAPPTGANIRFEGSDLAEGEVMVAAGARVDPGAIGILAAQGFAAVSVHRQPTVAIVSTGDELRDVGEPARPGSIVSSNAYALAAMVAEAGGIARVLPAAKDTVEAITDTFERALEADVVISSGGVSVGEHDHVLTAFERLGLEAGFWKVRMKPGKPLAFAKKGRVPVIGLPGNPVSAMVGFELFVRPGIRKMLGDPSPHRRRLPVTLAHPHRHSPGRPELARCKLSFESGGWKASLQARQSSGALTSMVGADGLVLLPAEVAELAEGTTLSAIAFRDAVGAVEPPFVG